MKTLEFGKWKITVDVEKTREYYENCKRLEDKASRNFKLYCNDLSSEEKSFFESFGVDIFSCYVETYKVELPENKEFLVCSGEFPVCVENIVYPYEYSLPIEEVIERYQAGTLDDNQIRIGRFRIEFLGKERSSVFMPKGFVCFEFFCDDIKWLLPEAVEKIDYEEKEKRHYYEAFSALGIKATEIDLDSLNTYKNDWVEIFAEPKENIEKIKDVCSAHIWHIFSYGFLACYEKESASELYDMQSKDECVFISNISDIAFIIEDANSLTAEILNQFIDVTVTAKDFSWTYCKTHEGDCGPYFYKKDKD